MSDILKNKTVVIMGLGLFGGGVDCAKFASRFAEKVIVTDKADEKKLTCSIKELQGITNIEFHIGSHNITDFTEADVIIVNPAVDEANQYIEAAKSRNKLITSQMEIFFQVCPAKIVAITGSNGKSTTTALTAHLLDKAKGAGRKKYGKVWLSGNIGNRPLLETIGQIENNDIAVIEISSFQLEQLARIKKSPYIGCITNISPNHLDRHKTMENYCNAKENIFRFQKDGVAILNANDKQCRQWYEKYKDTGRKCVLFDPQLLDDSLTAAFKLPGMANRENLAAAAAIAHQLGIADRDLAEAAANFVPLEHRLELIRTAYGVRYYNDSIATTPQSTIVAIEAFSEPKILIAGGYDKGLDFDQMTEAICDKLKALILMGQTAEKIEKSLRKTGKSVPVYRANSLAEAVKKARQIAQDGDVVLLSPACASYDMFVNFVQRGKLFGELVRQL